MTKSISILSSKELAVRALRFKDDGVAKWRGGPNFIMISRFGSRGSNSGTSHGRSKYSCGTERAYIGTIRRNLHASWAARARH